jgi:hypothetical protein
MSETNEPRIPVSDETFGRLWRATKHERDLEAIRENIRNMKRTLVGWLLQMVVAIALVVVTWRLFGFDTAVLVFGAVGVGFNLGVANERLRGSGRTKP